MAKFNFPVINRQTILADLQAGIYLLPQGDYTNEQVTALRFSQQKDRVHISASVQYPHYYLVKVG